LEEFGLENFDLAFWLFSVLAFLDEFGLRVEIWFYFGLFNKKWYKIT